MFKNRLLVICAGGHGKSVVEAAQMSGRFSVIGFLDDALQVGDNHLGVLVLGKVASVLNFKIYCDQVIVANGNNSYREIIMKKLDESGFDFATVIHPRSYVSPSAVIGKGVAVMAGAVVGTEAKLGIGSIVNSGAVVDHHSVVEDYGHLGVNACMAAGSFLGRGAWMQAGSSIGYGVKIKDGSTLLPGESLHI